MTGAVIAGGTARRMGTDKRSVLVDGVPMLRRTLLAVASVSDELLLACRRDDPPSPHILHGLRAHLVFDRYPDAGPMAGVEAALGAASNELVLVLAGDMPWASPVVLRALILAARADEETDVVALRSERGLEPLLAVYRARARGTARQFLANGNRRMHALLAALPSTEVGPDTWQRLDPTHQTPCNVNEPSDLVARDAGGLGSAR